MSVIEIKSVEEFETLIKDNKAVLVQFSATWCGPCKMIAPVVKKQAEKYADKIVFVKIDVDDLPELAQKYDVSSMPTFKFLINGEPSEEVPTVMGANPPKVLGAIEKLSTLV